MSGPEVTLGRLRTLFLKLDDEGLYVSATTVSLAIEEIERLSEVVEMTTGALKAAASSAGFQYMLSETRDQIDAALKAEGES